MPAAPSPRYGGVFRRFLGVVQGAKGAAWPRHFSTDPEHSNAAASAYPRLPILLSSTLSPPLASPYGFSMAAAARERAQRRRMGATSLGEGKGEREAWGEQCAGVRAGSVTPAAGLGARAVGGAEAGAAHRPPASAGLTPLRAASRGSRGSPASVPFPQVEGAAWDARAGVQWERAPPCCCQWRRMGPGPGVVRVCRVGSLPGCSVVPRRECCHRPRCACGGERRCGRLVWAFCTVSSS